MLLIEKNKNKMTEIEDKPIRNRKEDDLKKMINDVLEEREKKQEARNQILNRLSEVDDDDDEADAENNEKDSLFDNGDEEKKKSTSASKVASTYYQYQLLYINIIGLLIISVVQLICGPFVQPVYFVYVDIYAFLTAIFMLPIPALQWNFLLYYCIVACSFIFVKNLAIFVLDFGNFINCKSSQCSTTSNFTFYFIYYLFSSIDVGLMIYFVRLMYYILFTRKFEDNQSNSFDDGSKKIEIPKQYKKTE